MMAIPTRRRPDVQLILALIDCLTVPELEIVRGHVTAALRRKTGHVDPTPVLIRRNPKPTTYLAEYVE